jgi:hypothetical protein
MHTHLRRGLGAIGVAGLLLACQSMGEDSALFAFTFPDREPQEDFQVRLVSPQAIALARAELQLPLDERHWYPWGRVRRGPSGRDNPNWTWHLEEVELVATPAGDCDGDATQVEENLDHWVERVQWFCPSGAVVARDLSAPRQNGQAPHR